MASVQAVVTRLCIALLTWAAVGGVVVVGDARPAAACSCTEMTDSQAFAGADAAFIGAATDVDVPEAFPPATAPEASGERPSGRCGVSTPSVSRLPSIVLGAFVALAIFAAVVVFVRSRAARSA